MTESLTLSATETADALGVSTWSVYEAVRRGEIPNVASGRRVRVPRHWVDDQLGTADAAGITSLRPDEVYVALPVCVLPRLARLARGLAEVTEHPFDHLAAARIELASALSTSVPSPPGAGVLNGATSDESTRDDAVGEARTVDGGLARTRGQLGAAAPPS